MGLRSAAKQQKHVFFTSGNLSVQRLCADRSEKMIVLINNLYGNVRLCMDIDEEVYVE